MVKTCKKCGITKDINCFTKSKNIKDGYENSCKECRNKARKNKIKICEQCGKKFKTSRNSAKYCSIECQGISHRRRTKGLCAFCGNEIEIINSKINKHEFLYCNQKCRTEHLKIIMLGDNNPNFTKIKYKCDGCGKEILIEPYKAKTLKHNFCSYECYKNNIGKFYLGKNNSNWNFNLTEEERKDKRRYPEYYEWRSDVYKRDNYTCKCCGSNKSGTLIAHHLNSYNSDKEHRTDINNGITLCKECHAKFHNKYGYGNNTKEQFEEFIKTLNMTIPR